MVKNIIKEILIVILLTIVILLLLWVLFYEDNPTNKVIPSKVQYTVPENIKEELEEANVANETFGIEGKVYTVEGTDLRNYKKSNTYNPSKQNPYANTSAGTTNTLSNEIANGNSSSGSGAGTTNTQRTNSQGTGNTTKSSLK